VNTELDPEDIRHLDHAFRLAWTARNRGDHPFGAVIVAPDGTVVEGLNSVVTTRDPTGHAETNLVREAARTLEPAVLAASVLYTSTEPCAMCTGAIYWAGISRVVYALGEDQLIGIVDAQEGIPTMSLPCREVFAHGGRDVTVIGPVDLAEAVAVHAGFWTKEDE
jgi:tRNA(Arg) A34 adenosine deaminase TadA